MAIHHQMEKYIALDPNNPWQNEGFKPSKTMVIYNPSKIEVVGFQCKNIFFSRRNLALVPELIAL